MNSAEWLREFKFKLQKRIRTKISWGNAEVENEINKAYYETLEDMINPEE